MNLLEKHAGLVRKKLDEMPHGSEQGLAESFGEDWMSVGTPGQRKDFGRLFKTAVKRSAFEGIEWVGIANSGRHDIYRKR